jgi:hypothetical protein
MGQKFLPVYCLLLFFAAKTNTVSAQLVNSSLIHVNGKITVNGSLTNTGTVENNGVVEVSGNYNNQQTYTGPGKLVLTGNSVQTITTNNEPVNTLKIEGNGSVVVKNDLYIKDSLVLVNVVITPDPGVKIILDANAKIGGGSEDAHINGMLYQQGSGQKFYPVGKNGVYAPLTIDNLSGTDPVVGIELSNPNPNQKNDLSMENVSRYKMWSIEVLSGTFDGSTITLAFDESDSIVDLEKVLVAEADSLTGYFKSAGKSSAQYTTGKSGTVTSLKAITGKYFTVGNEPLDLRYFIPTALSPDASNIEDKVVKIYSPDVSEEYSFLFRIYNKWGNLVYQTESYIEASTIGWDGKNFRSGNDEEPGIYTFTVRGSFKSGRPFTKTGTITLVKM